MTEVKEKNARTFLERFADAKFDLSKRDIKKSGENKYSGFKYFELSDFMPHVIDVEKAYGITSLVTFKEDYAQLDIMDASGSSDELSITSPMREAELKGNHAIQNLGAVETYQRRYLYMAAYGIVEADVLDYTHDKNNPSSKDKKSAPVKNDENAPADSPISPEMVANIGVEIDALGFNYEKFCKTFGVSRLEDLKESQNAAVWAQLKKWRAAIEKKKKEEAETKPIESVDADELFKGGAEPADGYAELNQDDPFGKMK